MYIFMCETVKTHSKKKERGLISAREIRTGKTNQEMMMNLKTPIRDLIKNNSENGRE